MRTSNFLRGGTNGSTLGATPETHTAGPRTSAAWPTAGRATQHKMPVESDAPDGASLCNSDSDETQSPSFQLHVSRRE